MYSKQRVRRRLMQGSSGIGNRHPHPPTLYHPSQKEEEEEEDSKCWYAPEARAKGKCTGNEIQPVQWRTMEPRHTSREDRMLVVLLLGLFASNKQLAARTVAVVSGFLIYICATRISDCCADIYIFGIQIKIRSDFRPYWQKLKLEFLPGEIKIAISLCRRIAIRTGKI